MPTLPVGSISERRTDRLMTHHESGLPAFLVRESGLNSGLMMAHVTAAALTSEMKKLAHPAAVDSIPTSAGREDHVSMSMWAASRPRVRTGGPGREHRLLAAAASICSHRHPPPLAWCTPAFARACRCSSPIVRPRRTLTRSPHLWKTACSSAPVQLH
jgi:hypothetical protein